MERLPDSTLDSVIKLFDRTEKTILDECVLIFLKELQENRKAEENRLLVRLPCRVGDTVYKVYEDIFRYGVLKKSFDYSDIPDFGETVFLTEADAEAKLKEMEGGNEK